MALEPKILTTEPNLAPNYLSEFLEVFNDSLSIPFNITNEDTDELRNTADELIDLLVKRWQIKRTDFKSHFKTFVPDLCKMLATTSLGVEHDPMVIRVITFLCSLMETEHREVFEDEDLLSYIFNYVILLHIQLRPCEINRLKNKSNDWKNDTEMNRNRFALRRQKMVHFTSILGNNFPEKMRNLLSSYCETMAALVSEKRSAEFAKDKSAIIHHLTDVSRYLTNSKDAVIGIKDLVDVDNFYKNVISLELMLDIPNNNSRNPLMKVQMVRYLVTFMKLLTIDSVTAAVPKLVCYLFSDSSILVYHCTDAIRKILDFLATKTPYADDELQSFLSKIEKTQTDLVSSHRVYQWTCYMIIMSHQSQNTFKEFVSIVLPKLIESIGYVCNQNLRDSLCFRYFFRCLGQIIKSKRQASDLATAEFDSALIPVLIKLSHNVNLDVVSHAFEMLTIILAERNMPDDTLNVPLIELILNPPLWRRASHIYSLSRLLEVYIEAFGSALINSAYLDTIFGITVFLNVQTYTDHLAFNILNRIAAVSPVEATIKFSLLIFPHISARFKKVNTTTYANGALTFFSIIIVNHSLTIFITTADISEGGNYYRFLEWIIHKADPLLIPMPLRKICAMATSTIISTPAYVFEGRYSVLFLPFIRLSFNLIKISNSNPLPVGETGETSSSYHDDENAYFLRNFVFKEMEFAQSLRQLYMKCPSAILEICKLQPDLLKELLSYLAKYDVELRDVITTVVCKLNASFLAFL